MKLKLQLLFLILCAFILPAQLSPNKKQDHHGEEKQRPGHSPEERPGKKPEHKPEHRPDHKPEHRPDHKPEHRPDHKPEPRAEHRPGEKPGEVGHEHERKHGKRRGKVEDLLADYEDLDDGDDDDERRGDWLFELQNVRGSCIPNPCLNNGECEAKKWTFKCKCPKPFRGRRCEKGEMICKRDTCGYGQCVLTSTPPYYECKCWPPFKPPNCKSISPCEPNPCKNGGSCVKDGNDFDCVCNKGFSGKFCHVGPGDCYKGDGESYRGVVSETEDGDDCLFWNSYFILGKGINPFTAYEDDQGLGPHNYCRNPDGETKPWCFIRLGKKLRWDHCDVRKCSANDTATSAPPKPKPTTAKPMFKPTHKPVLKPTVKPTFKTTVKPMIKPTFRPTVKPTPLLPVPTKPSATHPPEILATTSHYELPPQHGDVPGNVPLSPSAEMMFGTCGKPQPKRSLNRIYGGLKALPGAQPWQVSIQAKIKGTTLPYKHICGGILIKPCWVMTAGHCISNKEDFQVVLGGLDLGKIEPSDQTLEVVETIVHEQYRETPDAVYNDIALLKVKAKDGTCAKETQYVKTACLPTETFPDGTECTISGWGATPDSQYGSSQLLDAEVLLISQDVCSSSKVYGPVIDQSMFCAGYLEGGVDSCQGDSGGPLTCSRNQTHYVYGIVSWGDNCGEKNKPGVYTRVTQYLDWINAKTASSSTLKSRV